MPPGSQSLPTASTCSASGMAASVCCSHAPSASPAVGRAGFNMAFILVQIPVASAEAARSIRSICCQHAAACCAAIRLLQHPPGDDHCALAAIAAYGGVVRGGVHPAPSSWGGPVPTRHRHCKAWIRRKQNSEARALSNSRPCVCRKTCCRTHHLYSQHSWKSLLPAAVIRCCPQNTG